MTHDASAKAVADHTRLLSELENTVKEVQPAAAGVAGNGKGTDTPVRPAGATIFEASADLSAPAPKVRSIQREVHDAAPDADPSAVHAHSLLVSEIEAVVPDSADGKPVHELTKGIQRVGTPAELNRVRGVAELNPRATVADLATIRIELAARRPYAHPRAPRRPRPQRRPLGRATLQPFPVDYHLDR